MSSEQVLFKMRRKSSNRRSKNTLVLVVVVVGTELNLVLFQNELCFFFLVTYTKE
jgi:hypothetical protein